MFIFVFLHYRIWVKERFRKYLGSVYKDQSTTERRYTVKSLSTRKVDRRDRRMVVRSGHEEFKVTYILSGPPRTIFRLRQSPPDLTLGSKTQKLFVTHYGYPDQVSDLKLFVLRCTGVVVDGDRPPSLFSYFVYPRKTTRPNLHR